MKKDATVGSLLSLPSADNLYENVLQRSECSYRNLSQRFAYKSKDFSKQFSHIYGYRLTKMREMLLKSIKKKWGSKYPIYKLQELKEDEPKKCIIIGTLFKHQELKPSILKEISEDLQLQPQPPRSFFVDDKDTLILEDELQRITIVGNIDVHSVVTGIVCAILGKEGGGDKFFAEEICWAGMEQVARPIPAKSAQENFIVLLSGLDVANSAGSLMPLQLFADWIGGSLGDVGEQQQQARAVRVVIAGNSLRGCADHKVDKFVYTHAVDDVKSLDNVKLLDDFLQQLTRVIDVDVMAGEFDPANHMLPQQPLHYCLLPESSAYQTMHGVCNPYEFEVDSCRVLGSSGQPIKNIAQYSKLSDPLEILEATLRWGHLAPTCPDTIPCYPYYQEDPFIINEVPDIYFAGNQPQFQTKLHVDESGKKVRLICVPAFSSTHSCVVVNLATLDCYPMSFDVSPEIAD